MGADPRHIIPTKWDKIKIWKMIRRRSNLNLMMSEIEKFIWDVDCVFSKDLLSKINNLQKDVRKRHKWMRDDLVSIFNCSHPWMIQEEDVIGCWSFSDLSLDVGSIKDQFTPTDQISEVEFPRWSSMSVKTLFDNIRIYLKNDPIKMKIKMKIFTWSLNSIIFSITSDLIMGYLLMRIIWRSLFCKLLT